jgi:hypothetical protein
VSCQLARILAELNAATAASGHVHDTDYASDRGGGGNPEEAMRGVFQQCGDGNAQCVFRRLIKHVTQIVSSCFFALGLLVAQRHPLPVEAGHRPKTPTMPDETTLSAATSALRSTFAGSRTVRVAWSPPSDIHHPRDKECRRVVKKPARRGQRNRL